jgi:hypothetical protein
MKLDFDTSKLPESTHYVCDEGCGYYVTAKRKTMDAVATAFLDGYDGSGKIEFWVRNLKTDETQDYIGRPNGKAARA